MEIDSGYFRYRNPYLVVPLVLDPEIPPVPRVPGILYVTAIGLDVSQAAELVSAMAGPYRMPDALRRVDGLSRGRGRGCGSGAEHRG